MLYLITYLMIGLVFGIIWTLIFIPCASDLDETKEVWNEMYETSRLDIQIESTKEIMPAMYISILMYILIWPIQLVASIIILYKYLKHRNDEEPT